MNFLKDLIFNSIGVAAVLGSIGYFLRETITKIFTRSVEHRFDEKLEQTKADFRANEREIEAQISASEQELKYVSEFLATKKRERDTLIQAKRIEAAEIALRTCNVYAKLAMAVETMKIMDIEALSRRTKEPEIQEFFKTLLVSMNVDELMEIALNTEQTLPSLYLDEYSASCLNTYKFIIIHAVSIMRSLSNGIEPRDFFKVDALRKEVVALAPISEESFDKYGEHYAYYWLQYFYDQTLKSLRELANGQKQVHSDAETARNLLVTSRVTQAQARVQVENSGLPTDIFLKDADIPKLPTEKSKP